MVAGGTEARDGAVRPLKDGTRVAASAEYKPASALTATDFCGRGGALDLASRGSSPEARCCLCRIGGKLPGQWNPSREGPGSMRLSSRIPDRGGARRQRWEGFCGYARSDPTISGAQLSRRG